MVKHAKMVDVPRVFQVNRIDLVAGVGRASRSSSRDVLIETAMTAAIIMREHDVPTEESRPQVRYPKS